MASQIVLSTVSMLNPSLALLYYQRRWCSLSLEHKMTMTSATLEMKQKRLLWAMFTNNNHNTSFAIAFKFAHVILILSQEEKRWRTEVEERETLEIYRAKKRIGEEGIYSNDGGSVTLFRCRTNKIKMNWRQRFHRGIVDCPMWESGAEETPRHFLKGCRGLGDIREIH